MGSCVRLDVEIAVGCLGEVGRAQNFDQRFSDGGEFGCAKWSRAVVPERELLGGEVGTEEAALEALFFIIPLDHVM